MPWELTVTAWETRAMASAHADGPPRTGAATRLLVLGCVRIFQPVHGYFLRRELVSWRVDEWANVHPGSIYSALRTLTRDGLLDEVAVGAAGSRPRRTAFALTDDGGCEFLARVRTSLAVPGDPVLFLVAISFANALPRDEVLTLLRERIERLRTVIAELNEKVAMMLAAAASPPATIESPRVHAARLAGEAGWAEDYVERVGGGAYSFAGETPDWTPSPQQVSEARAAGAGLTGGDLPLAAPNFE
jgi:DNA-binding PadR family transcriptional regulator